MRNISYIVFHCTATNPNAKPEAIQSYWKNNLGWKNPGYHYLISSDGIIHQLADESIVCNGVAGYNSKSVHVSYIGGIDDNGAPHDTRTPEQIRSMKEMVVRLREKYPKAIIQGHRDFPNVHKACPSFDVKTWLKSVNIQ